MLDKIIAWFNRLFFKKKQKLGIVYDGFHSIEKKEVLIKGKKRIYEIVGISSAVAGLVFDAEGKICLVRQYRPALDEFTLELPAGIYDKPGLSPIDILVEELREECHIPWHAIRNNMMPILQYNMVGGSSRAKMLVYACQLRTIHQTMYVDDAEVEQVLWVTEEEFMALIKTGQIKDSKTLMSGFYLQNNTPEFISN